MALFSRRGTKDSEYPFLTAEQGAAMRGAVAEALDEISETAVIGDGHAVLSDGAIVGFDNMARAISEIPAQSPELSGVVAHFVTSVVASMRTEPATVTAEVLAASGYLRLIDAQSMPPQMLKDFEYAEWIGDRARAIIALDEPQSVRMVAGTRLEGVDLDRARQLGYVNLINDTLLEREVVEVEGGTVHSLSGASMFVGSRLLVLGEELARLGADAPNGAVAIAPDRHHLHFHVVQDLGAVKVMNLLQNVALGAYNEEQGAISPCVYWWHQGRITQLTRIADDGTVAIDVPDELTEILNTLS